MATKHTPADIVSMIRATENGNYALSVSEAALAVQLFASVAVAEATASNVVRIGDHDPDFMRKVDLTRIEMGAT